MLLIAHVYNQDAYIYPSSLKVILDIRVKLKNMTMKPRSYRDDIYVKLDRYFHFVLNKPFFL